MTRCLLLIAVGSFGLSFQLFNAPEAAQAQAARAGTDPSRFMAATRGIDYDRSGLKWCYSQYFHESYRDGPANAIDELPQAGSKPQDCRSVATEKVDLTAYGFTDNPNCIFSMPCSSLRV